MSAATIIRVRVEQRHIDAGTRNECSYCPIALAIKDAIRPTKGHVRVEVAALVKIDYRVYDLAPEADAAWRLFDLGRGMEPFEFDLDLTPLEG